MTTERSIDELVNEFNAKAKAEGSYDDRAFWEVPATPESILNVPETPESLARIASLRKRIAELNQEARKRSESVQEIHQEASHPIGAQPSRAEQPPAG
jgi:hypothetical protein